MIVNQRGKVIFPPLVIFGMKKKQKTSHGMKKKQKHSHGLTRNYTEGSRNREMVILHPLGAKSKGSNGVVAVGLPHRNSSVFKQADPNKW